MVSFKLRRWSMWLITLTLLALAGVAAAQVAPSGADATTVGPGAGVVSPVSPTGGYQATVPIDLPSPRGNLPVPFAVSYTGLARAGAAGAGWDVPLSYVSVSNTVRHRKPASASNLVDEDHVPERIIVALSGAMTVMVPSTTAGTYLAFVSDSYMVLRATEDGWLLHLATGVEYVFETDGGGVELLTEIRDRLGTDRVLLRYDSEPHGACPSEVNLIGLSYGLRPNGRALYDVAVEYEPWWESTQRVATTCETSSLGVSYQLSRYDDLGPQRSRSRVIDRVVVKARNNLEATSSFQVLRRYDFAYETVDADTALPRLTSVDVLGQGATGDALPVVRYEYAAAATNGVHYGDAEAVARPDFVELIGRTSLASSVTTSWESSTLDPPGMHGENIQSRHLIRDFTGDNVPDFLFKHEDTWYLYPGKVSDAGVTLGYGVVSSWTEPAELFLQTTSSYDDLEPAAHRAQMVTTETWAEFLDWNGDGRLDVLDARSAGLGMWRVWLNRPVGTLGVEWEAHDIEPSDLLEHIDEHGLDPTRLFVPLERTRSWPRVHTYRCEERVFDGEWSDFVDCTPDDDGQPEQQDSVAEWTLADVNGDSFPDTVVNSNPVRWCAVDDNPPCEAELIEGTSNTLETCTFTHDEWLTTNNCFAGEGVEPNVEMAFLNREGAVTGLPDEPRSYPATVVAGGNGVSRWTTGAAEGMYDETINLSMSWKASGFVDVHSLGIPQYRRDDVPGGYEQFKSTKPMVCTPSSGDYPVWETSQVSGLADINGDGIADHVYLNHEDPENQQVWRVRFGTTSGFGPAHAIGSSLGFAISETSGTCGGSTTNTTAALIDLDGDGKPEVVHADENGIRAAELVVETEVGGVQAGRLVAVENGYGARTEIQWSNNKADVFSTHGVPAPEIVVSQTQTVVLDGSAVSSAVVRFAYGDAESRYDPLLNRTSFAGYRRTVVVVAESTPRTGPEIVEGIASMIDHVPQSEPGAGYEAFVLGGRVARSYRLEGLFNVDPRRLLSAAPNDIRVRAASSVEYGVQPLSAGGWTSGDLGLAECVDVDPSGIDFADVLCTRAGIVYDRVTTAWEGRRPLPSDENVVQVTEVVSVDARGRPREIVRYGDVRTTADELCIQMHYAVPTDDATPATSALASVYIDDCGWTNSIPGGQPMAGAPILLAGTRYIYDELPEGEVERGKLSSRVVEVYDVETGAFFGEHVAEELTYNPMGEVKKVVRTRNEGSTGVRKTHFEYDAFGSSLIEVREQASDVSEDPFVRTLRVSTWPSVANEMTSLNGEVSIVQKDRFGRPTSTKVTAPGFFHTLRETIYDDNSSGREVTTVEYPTSQTSPQKSHVHLDALGRPVFRQTELGADYAGATIVSGLVQYDSFGRVVYQAAPFEWPEIPFTPDDLGPNPIDLPYGATFLYDEAGRTVATIEAAGRRPDVTETSVPDDEYVSTYAYAFEAGRAKVRVLGPNEHSFASPTFGAWTETSATALGWIEEQAQYTGAGDRIDLVRYDYDPLGHQTEVRRYGGPAAATDPVSWTTRYDSLGRALELNEPGMSPLVRRYDEWGAPISSEMIDGNLQSLTAMTYDGFGRLKRRKVTSYDASTSVETVDSSEVFHYDLHSGTALQPAGDLRGRLSWAHAAGAGNIFYSYDVLGRLATETHAYTGHPNTVRTGWEHEPGGAVRELTFETQVGTDHIAYAYDSAGRTRSITDLVGGVTLFDATQIDAKGRYRHVRLGNGVEEDFAYLADGREELSKWSVQTTTEDRGHSFALRDGEGRLLEEQVYAGLDGGRTITHTFDALDRLIRDVTTQNTTSVTLSDEDFAYDPLGNLKGKDNAAVSGQGYGYSYDSSDPDRLCRFDAAGNSGSACHFGYDGRGNVTADSSGAQARAFTYDGASRITGIARGSARASFRYGPGGGRIRTEVWTGATTLDRRVWSFGGLVEERVRPDGKKQLERRIPGPLGIVATLRTQANGSVRDTIYVHGDGRANRFFTRSNGAIVQSATYSSYGILGSDTGNPSSISYSDDLWNGGDELAPVGVVVLGARIYDPKIGRFLQRDPLVLAGSSTSANPYSFSFNDPVNYADPSGALPYLSIMRAFTPSNASFWGFVAAQFISAYFELGGDMSFGHGSVDTAWGAGCCINAVSYKQWESRFLGGFGDGVVHRVKQIGVLTGGTSGTATGYERTEALESIVITDAEKVSAVGGILNGAGDFADDPIGSVGNAVDYVATNPDKVGFAAGVATTDIAVFGVLRAGVGAAAESGANGTTTFFRGMTYGEALEVIEAQGLNAQRILANQRLNPGAAGSGAYVTSQEATAVYYGELAGLQGRGLGPAVVRIDIPTPRWEAFARLRCVSVESTIPRGPFSGATETLIPAAHIPEFNSISSFLLHR